MAPVMVRRPPRSFTVASVLLLLLLFAFRSVSALLAYDCQTLLNLRAWSETLLPSNRPLFDQQTPLLADSLDHLRWLPTVSPRRNRDQKSRSNGSYGSEHRRWLSCPLPQRSRSIRRGKMRRCDCPTQSSSESLFLCWVTPQIFSPYPVRMQPMDLKVLQIHTSLTRRFENLPNMTSLVGVSIYQPTHWTEVSNVCCSSIQHRSGWTRPLVMSYGADFWKRL